jgi:hypothetical protein
MFGGGYFMKNNTKRWAVFLVFLSLLAGCATVPTISDEEQKLLSEIAELLDTNIENAEGKIEFDPETAADVQGLVKLLHEKRKFVRQVESGEIPFDPESMRQIAVEVKKIEASVRRPVEKTWSADVYFGLGKYKVEDLSEHETENFKGFIREFTEIGTGILKKLPLTKELVIFIKTFGYADGTALLSKTKNALMKNMSEKLPRSRSEMKQVLNTEISRRRSQSVNDCVRTELNAGLKHPQVSFGKPRIVSMGETYPYPEDTVSPPYRAKDERRRVCKVYMTITVKNR